MPRHEDDIRLRQMRDHAREAIGLMEGKTRDELEHSRTLQLALVRLVEIVGEAASRVSKEAQLAYAQIPWPQITSMRNRLVHGYDFVDLDILWQTVREDLPRLVRVLEHVIPQVE